MQARPSQWPDKGHMEREGSGTLYKLLSSSAVFCLTTTSTIDAVARQLPGLGMQHC